MFDGFTLVQIGLTLLTFAAALSLNERRLDLQKENKELKNKLLKVKRENTNLNTKINKIVRDKEKTTNEIKEIIKYAMKAAHPDNGGKVEDFVKFYKMYQNLGGR